MKNCNLHKNEYDKSFILNFLQKSVVLSMNDYLSSMLSSYIYSRYFFNTNTQFVQKENDFIYLVDDIPIEDDLVYAVYPHDRILILRMNDYIELYKHSSDYHISSYQDINESMTWVKQLDKIALNNPVILKTFAKNCDAYIRITYNEILIELFNKNYVIPRDIFDMLYVEHEDFVPTVDETSPILIHSQVRHSIYYENEYVMDLLKSDIGMICDIQDKLKKENELISNINVTGMTRKIFGIHGLKGSGKDTLVTFIKMHIFLSKSSIQDTQRIHNFMNLAINNINNSDWLLDQINVGIERFATPLKACIASFLGIDVNELNSQEYKNKILNPDYWYNGEHSKITVRDLHLIIADSLKQSINEDIFANTCIERIVKSNFDIMIVNDLRFESELLCMIRENAYLVKINRKEAVDAQQKELDKHKLHISELGLPSDKFDYLISNNGTYEDLAIKTADMLLDAGVLSNDYVKTFKTYISNN